MADVLFYRLPSLNAWFPHLWFRATDVRMLTSLSSAPSWGVLAVWCAQVAGRSLEEDRRQQHTVCMVDIKANKHQIQQAVKKLHDLATAKVNTLIRHMSDMSHWLLTWMLWKVPTKLGSSKLNTAG
ncbi:hypothetical protein J0S82_013934 [Galemys pyrenaicus]|uniref:Uncharacterized protein n=1 Tax=Galemys pyrenaicus TaxID=202257 RepID=A0A8J6ALV8_GALPY|nr:hypothetical protein J0S82_013934 [Galemys pyrenaicus]